jgi:hypothetical protein
VIRRSFNDGWLFRPKADSVVAMFSRAVDGRALAVIRPTAPGRIAVRVTAEGCAPAVVTVEAIAAGGAA